MFLITKTHLISKHNLKLRYIDTPLQHWIKNVIILIYNTTKTITFQNVILKSVLTRFLSETISSKTFLVNFFLNPSLPSSLTLIFDSSTKRSSPTQDWRRGHHFTEDPASLSLSLSLSLCQKDDEEERQERQV